MHELILYATPTGPLADACAAYFDAVQSTTAQTYPPHVTLTGFFHRRDRREPIDAASVVGEVPAGVVEIRRLTCNEDWVGLEVDSPWLEAAAASFAQRMPPAAGEDDIRVKDWLHLSLAYGVPDLGVHADRARQEIDVTQPVGWEVGLWERSHGDHWERLT